ncbi:MAG: hypothetical protein ACFFED_17720 [Candidatus Thorarchaeota archaeon]
MDPLSGFTLFLVSVVICAIAGGAVKRSSYRVNRMGLLAFHILYVFGMILAMIFL